ncbi:MAG: hypothetical protein U0234_24285 [Sandaracinus sp.]
MRAALAIFTLALAVGSTAPAAADAIGGPCPSGQVYQANPTQPGAMHHSGGQCVPDPSASHCAAHPGHARAHAAAIALGAAVLLAGRRSRRDKVRAR